MNRRLRKSKKFYIYVVVFVAFVNACFYCPEVQAASASIDECYLYLDYASTVSSDPVFTTDSNFSSSVIVFDQTLGTPVYSYHDVIDFTIDIFSDDFVNGDYFEYSFDLFFFTSMNNSSSVSMYVPTFSVLNPSYSGEDGNSEGINYFNNYDITFDSILNHYDSSSYSGIHITISGNYNVMSHLCFSFKLKGTVSSDSKFTRAQLRMQWISQDLQVFGSDVSVSQNVQDLVDGYDDSAGSQAASELGNSASGYEQAEGNLFQGSESSLSGFEFFDFSGYTGITTGLSFVSTMMQSIYSNLGGMSGIGIVISVLFSVMFLAIVIGLYRYFK